MSDAGFDLALIEAVGYNPETGSLFWKPRHNNKAFNARYAGVEMTKNQKGYVRIKFRGKYLLGHRVAWLLYYGRWPETFLDHINGVPDDNRIANLRSVTHTQNMWNAVAPSRNSTGIKGVSYARKNTTKPWHAVISIAGKSHSIGYFKTAEEAKKAYSEKAYEIRGDFHFDEIHRPAPATAEGGNYVG